MTTDDRLVRDLPGILGELADGPYPDYIDALLADSATVRQRPGWTFPEWWLPMLDIVRRPLLVTAIPWRPILLVILMLALLFGAALFAGVDPGRGRWSRPRGAVDLEQRPDLAATGALTRRTPRNQGTRGEPPHRRNARRKERT